MKKYKHRKARTHRQTGKRKRSQSSKQARREQLRKIGEQENHSDQRPTITKQQQQQQNNNNTNTQTNELISIVYLMRS